MINIVIYGKPRSFESHEYGFDVDNTTTSVDNSFPEPLLKPKNYQEMVLHYFSKNGYSGIEIYNRAKGYESERDGIVFGIALKTDHDFDMTKVVDNVLMQYWSDFASVLLNDEERFASPSILEVLNGTKWGDEDVSIIRQSIGKEKFRTPNKKICLLYAPEYDCISVVESQLKEYGDVYISDNPDIFKDPINSVVLKITDGRIHTIKDSTIVEYKEGNNTSSTLPKRKEPYQWGKNKKKRPAEGTSTSNDDYPPQGYGDDETKVKIKWKKIAAIAVALVAIVLAIILFNPKLENKKSEPYRDTTRNGAGGGASRNNAGENINVEFKLYNEPIENDLSLRPRLPENSPYVIGDFEFKVDHNDIVELITVPREDGYIKLKVKQRPNNNTTVTVNAIYNGQVIGSTQYTIAKKKSDPEVKREKSNVISEPVTIHYDKFDLNHKYKIDEVETVYAKDAKGNIITGGIWTIQGGDGLTCNEPKKNPMTVTAKKKGHYTITFTYYSSNSKSISTQFIVVP